MVQLNSKNLMELIRSDEELTSLCVPIGPRKVMVLARKELAFRKRLKELEYVLM